MNLPEKFNSVNSNKSKITTLGFTDDQRNAYNELIDFINAPYNPNDFKRALVGAGGTGKTYLLKALISNCGMSYSTIGVSAPTHKALRVIQESIGTISVHINTLQSDLGLRLNFNVENFNINNPPFDPKGRIKIKELKLYIIDEASMINRGLSMFVEKTCKTNGCKLIYVGDSSQLAPVNEKYSSAFKGVKTYFLNKIVRQNDTNPVRNLLDLLRNDVKNKTYTFLEYISRHREEYNEDLTEGFEVCTPGKFNQLVYQHFNDERLTTNVDFCKIIAYTNNCVSNWNKFIRNAVITNADKSIITKHDLFISYVTIVNKFNEIVIKNSEEYIVKDVVNYVHPKYNLKGFMIQFQAIHGGKVTSPLFVIDHTDQFTLQMYCKITFDMINAAKSAKSNFKSTKWKEYYEFKESCLILVNILNTKNSININRDIDYGFALTSHKSQGSTFENVLVDVNDIVYDKFGHPYTDAEEVNRRLYVACSRCSQKLYLQYGY